MKIFDRALTSFKNNLPFVIYRKPNKDFVSGFFMDEDALFYTDKFSESGFVFAPFNSYEKAILFPLSHSKFYTENLILEKRITNKKIYSEVETSKESHIKLVEKTIKEISKSDLQKVVISRKEEIQLLGFDFLKVYKDLLQSYKNAFVYVWYHPKVGLWLGATPETLLHIKDSYFKTMSLAGTQVDQNSTNSKTELLDNIIWKNKELEEQQLVTNFIENQLKGISSNLKIDKKETIKAGDLLHLRTKVEGSLNSSSDLKSLIRALHPTPAVCGLPREIAHQFIIENENYYRTFYTGFLGELNLRDSKQNHQCSQLYVNLRCMKVENDKASIFVGGGITLDSNSNNEWEETVSKTKTMKRVL